MPTSLATLVAAFGALFSGWKTPFGYRVWLWLSAVLILAVWVFTVVVFWPSNAALLAAASGSTNGVEGKAELIRLTHQWVKRDSVAGGDDGSRIHLGCSGHPYSRSSERDDETEFS
jgi:uncharacterized membrane protein